MVGNFTLSEKNSLIHILYFSRNFHISFICCTFRRDYSLDEVREGNLGNVNDIAVEW